MIRRNVELEARLIDDLLDVTRIGRGKIRLDREVGRRPRADPPGAARSAAARSAAGGLGWSSTWPPADHHVDADPARLQQVFWNLIKNAVKFTPARRPDRRPHRATRRPDAAAAAGWSSRWPTPASASTPEVLPRIFDAFEQGDDAGHPAVRRAGPGPGDQPGAGRGPRRHAHRRQRGPGPGGDLHARAAHGRPSPPRPPGAGEPAAGPARRPARPRAAPDPAGRGRRRTRCG